MKKSKLPLTGKLMSEVLERDRHEATEVGKLIKKKKNAFVCVSFHASCCFKGQDSS
jgi:hypothetical protein